MSIIIGLCIKKFEKKEKAWPEKTTLKMCSVLTIKLLMKKIEKVINKEIKKKRSAWCFLATKKILQTCLW